MMSKSEKISLLMSLSNEVDFFVGEVKGFIPSLLTDRYQMTELEYVDTILSVVDVEKIDLEKKLRGVYEKHLDDDELDNLILLCGAYTKVEIQPELYDALEDAKDSWFDGFIFKVDLIMGKMQDGDFSN